MNQVQGGSEYYKNITDRLGGQGVGYGDQYADQASNPVIARMSNQFKSYQLPELYSELSSQGRRKGSGGFDQIRRAYQEEGLNEGDVYSGLYQQNEQQKRSEINDAFGRLGNYANNEANLVGNRASFDTGQYQNELAQAQNQRQEGNAAFGRLLGTAALGIQGVGGIGGVQGGGQGQAMLSQNYAPQTQYPTYFGGVPSIYSAKYGQQGGVNPYQTRLKY